MKYPNFSLEYTFLQRKFKSIAGIDEVGRGCLAGPVVTAAVVINKQSQYVKVARLVRDSKLLSAKQRNIAADKLKKVVTSYSYGLCSSTKIDSLGIYDATNLAMIKAYYNLGFPPEITLIDGRNTKPFNSNCYTFSQGDTRIFTIAAASILAKVYRDNLMANKYHSLYPQYGFKQHKGYGTAAHLKNLKRFGPSNIHRYSFKPVYASFRDLKV